MRGNVSLVRARIGTAINRDEVQVTAEGPLDGLRLALNHSPVGNEPYPSWPVLDEHLAVHLDGTNTQWAQIADVVLHHGDQPPRGFSGLVACAIDPEGHGTITVRDEPDTVFAATPQGAIWLASFVHAWLVTGRPAAALMSMRITVRRVPTAAP